MFLSRTNNNAYLLRNPLTKKIGSSAWEDNTKGFMAIEADGKTPRSEVASYHTDGTKLSQLFSPTKTTGWYLRGPNVKYRGYDNWQSNKTAFNAIDMGGGVHTETAYSGTSETIDYQQFSPTNSNSHLWARSPYGTLGSHFSAANQGNNPSNGCTLASSSIFFSPCFCIG